MDVPGVLRALDAIGFRKLVCVELSRESHRADTMIPAAMPRAATKSSPGGGVPITPARCKQPLTPALSLKTETEVRCGSASSRAASSPRSRA